MADLMAMGSDAGDALSAIVAQLRGAGVAVDLLALDLIGAVGLVGPDGIGRGACLLAIACIDDMHIVDEAVVITVIYPQVGLSSHKIEGLFNHLLGMHVILVLIVLTVVLHIA